MAHTNFLARSPIPIPPANEMAHTNFLTRYIVLETRLFVLSPEQTLNKSAKLRIVIGRRAGILHHRRLQAASEDLQRQECEHGDQHREIPSGEKRNLPTNDQLCANND